MKLWNAKGITCFKIFFYWRYPVRLYGFAAPTNIGAKTNRSCDSFGKLCGSCQGGVTDNIGL